MKKTLIAKLVILLIILFLVCGLASTFFFGKDFNLNIFHFRSSKNLELVTEENFKDVYEILVDVVEEDVIIYQHNSNQIIVKFFGDRDRTPRMTQNNGELRIEREHSWNFFFSFNASGRVEIYMPTETIRELDINGVSGNVEIKPNIDQVEVDTVSGSITGYGSGQIANLNTVSGNIKMYGTFNDIDAETVSGNIRLKTKEDTQIKADTVSGAIRCNLYREDVGYSLDFDSVSGKFTDRYNDQKFSGEVNTSFGDNELSFNVETVSGNFKLENWD